MTETQNDFEGWALLELMGHHRIVGYVSTQNVGGAAMVRVDVPEVDGQQAWSKFVGTSAIYGLTPMGEQAARELAKTIRATPINAYEFPSDVQAALRVAREARGQPLLPAVGPSDFDDEDDEHPGPF